MSINANRLVSISPRVIDTGGDDLETNGLLLTTSELIPSGTPALEFTSASAVSAYFGSESGEYDFAAQYFSGVNNQQKAISALWIGRRIAEDAAAWLRSGEVTATLAELKEITEGTLSLTVNGTAVEATIDLSEATSLSDVAEIIATAIGSVTGTYDSTLSAFTFTTEATGADATITVCDTSDAATLLCLTSAAGAVVSDGADAQTAAEDMDAICEVTRNWVGFTTLYTADEDEAVALAAWADIDDDYVYFAWTTDSNCTSALTNSETLPVVLQSYNCVAVIYGDWAEAAMFLAIGASIDWTAYQGIKTWFGKTASGITARVTGDTAAEALDDIRCNYIGSFATRNESYIIANRGYLAGDLYSWIDVLYGLIWFKAKLQRSIMDGFTSVNRAPYNALGYALVEAWMMDPINAARKAGVIDTGLDLTTSQKAQILQEVGEDISTVLYAKGYWYKIESGDGTERSDRESPDIALYYTYAGSIQQIEFPVTAVL